MNVDDIPVLKRSAKIAEGDARFVIRYLTDEITLEGGAAELFGKMLPHLDGKTGIEEIATALLERPGRLRALTGELEHLGALRMLDGQSAVTRVGEMTGPQFYAFHRKHCNHWLMPVYLHPLWEKIATGQASRAQVLGLAFEKYHYIEGAYEHMAVAAANATPEMMPHLARHFVEEYQHGDIYRKGLCSLFTNEAVLSAQPLPSTRALINFLREAAERNSFAYYAGNELLQMTENTGEDGAAGAVDDFYSAMRRHYPYTDKIIDSFVAHTNADQKLGHRNVFIEICQSISPLSTREVADAMNVVRSMADHLMLFLDGIDAHYAHFPAIPRTPCNLLSE